MSDTILNLKGIKQIAKLYYVNGYYKEALSFCNILVEQDSIKYLQSSEIIKLINNSTFAIDAIENPSDFSPSNLGSNINSENEEYLPAISYDGKNLVFSRRFVKEGLLQEDFFISKKDENNIWGLSKPYVGSLNTNGNEGAFSFSSNNNCIVFTACDRYDSMGSCDIYLLIDGNIFNAGNVINSKDWDSQACFSPNGNYLYFVSSRQDGYGGKDIWRSKITKNGFLKAENLGPEINTKDDEMSPFLHPDNLTFYFSSNGHIGMGDYDIFICKRFNTLENWKSPDEWYKKSRTELKEWETYVDKDVSFFSVGKKGGEWLGLKELNVVNSEIEIFNNLNFQTATPIAERLMNEFASGNYDKVVLVYNHFKNAATQLVQEEQFLPIVTDEGQDASNNTEYIYEPDKESIIEELIPKSLKTQLFKALLDSHAAEHGARMTAMHKATDNASELKKDLTLTYNKARQAAITGEILEIVGGAEALNG